ncbi:hypothetical protein, partial [Mitsuokella jalaludinii]|uniref:hypothetical protein n=1 Tax=Mitsuokella jalaludinii TaxID=187979 RepID=UPI0030788BE1
VDSAVDRRNADETAAMLQMDPSLNRLLGREEEVRQSAESVLAAIGSMKQSILARAFRGELGA